ISTSLTGKVGSAEVGSSPLSVVASHNVASINPRITIPNLPPE
ncbi:uncharacterized protein METZ01_LOCUS137528, partial [marine metagenome]